MKKFLIYLLLLSGIGITERIYAQIQEGDTLQFLSVSYIDWPPLWGTPQRVVNAICKKAGSHCYVFVEDSAPQPSQAKIDTLVHRFDSKYFPLLTTLYGHVPDEFDNDSSVFILVLNESNWGGYFDPGQQMADTFVYSHWGRHSSEREIIYIAADYFNYASEVVTHEFGHLLHWQQDHSPEPIINPVKYWEDAWIDEGFSTFAAEYLTNDITQEGVVDGNAFFNVNPDVPLIYFQDYDQVLLWTMFMYEHFGGDLYIKTLISEQANGILGVRKTLINLGYSETFEDAFEQWIIANYIDNPDFDGGKYYYHHFDFPTAHVTYTHYNFPTGIKTQSVTPFGADYNVFNTTSANPLTITFNGDSTFKFRLAFILINSATASVVDVIKMQPDHQNTVIFNADSFGIAYNKIVMSVMSVDTLLGETETAGYSYHAESTGAGIQENISDDDILIFPNPASNRLLIRTDKLLQVKSNYEILNLTGKVVSTGIIDKEKGSIDISNLQNSEYFLKIYINSNFIIKKIVIRK